MKTYLIIILLVLIKSSQISSQQNDIGMILVNNELNNLNAKLNRFIKSNTLTRVYLIGNKLFDNDDLITFRINNINNNITDNNNNICIPYLNQTFNLEIIDKTDRNSIAQSFIVLSDAYESYDLCFKAKNQTHFIYQNNIKIFIHKPTLPSWLQIMIR
jgi:benzoyl-CoA reductase/2-hydroxyglutaryl-CoA dehydratase subunit BcrC/BadD/HgdB